MKRILLIIVAVFVLFPVYGFSDNTIGGYPYTEFGDVGTITVLGELSNLNSGGFYFYTTKQPKGLNVFVVGGDELYINRILATLLSAKNMNKRVSIVYNLVEGEGEVVGIAVE